EARELLDRRGLRVLEPALVERVLEEEHPPLRQAALDDAQVLEDLVAREDRVAGCEVVGVVGDGPALRQGHVAERKEREAAIDGLALSPEAVPDEHLVVP